MHRYKARLLYLADLSQFNAIAESEGELIVGRERAQVPTRAARKNEEKSNCRHKNSKLYDRSDRRKLRADLASVIAVHARPSAENQQIERRLEEALNGKLRLVGQSRDGGGHGCSLYLRSRS